jgi:hypothetical protein
MCDYRRGDEYLFLINNCGTLQWNVLFRIADSMTSQKTDLSSWYTLYSLDIERVVKQPTKVMKGLSQEHDTNWYMYITK